MTKASRRSITLTLGLLVLVVVATYLTGSPRQRNDVPIPPRDATPERVVTTFIAALNAHDCDTAAALTTGDVADRARSWCEDISTLTDVIVSDHSIEPPEPSGRSAPDEVVFVAVTFDVDWRRFHGDTSMEEGNTVWGYRLVRNAEDSPWRIVDQGVG